MKKAAIIGAVAGLVIGILGLIPCVSCLNCILIFVPGVLAVHFAIQDGQVVSTGGGSKLGAVSGVTCSLASMLINIPLSLLMGGAEFAKLQQMMSQQGMSGAEAAMGGTVLIIAILIGIPVGLALVAGFNAVSGLVYAMIKNR